MPESNLIRVKRDGLIVLSDAGGVNTYTVAFEPGDLSINVPDTAVNVFLDRGRMGAAPSLRLGDDAPCELSFSAYLRNVSGSDFTTLLDIAHRYDGGHVETEWVSTSEGDVFTIDCSVIFDGADIGEADEQLDFNFCVMRASLSEGDPNTVSVTITSYVTKPTKV